MTSIRLQVIEGQQRFLAQAQELLRQRFKKADSALADALYTKKEAEDKANAYARALAEVRAVINFPIDTVNRSLLFIT